MSFPGKPTEPKTKTPLRTFIIYNEEGLPIDEVKAHYLRFEPAHVTFWADNDPEYDTLIGAYANETCRHIEEEV